MRFWLTTALLTLLLFALSAVDFAGTAWNVYALGSPGWSLFASGLTATALGWAAVRARWHGWRLVMALGLVHYGVAVLMTAVEAVYLTELRPLLGPMLINGALTAILFAPTAVALHARMGTRRAPGAEAATAWWAWALVWKLPLLAVTWMVIFVLAGTLVFLPVARQTAPDLLAGYTDVPTWVLPFQGLRAVLWVLLALPILLALKGRWWPRALMLGILFAALMGSNLLLPNPLLPAELQVAHFAEVVLANFLFGFVSGWLILAVGRREQEDRPRRAAGPRESQQWGS